MKDERLIELKKENDKILEILSPSYKQIGQIYIKKARSYAVKSVDTELKINDVLKRLEEYSEKNLQRNIAIPNETSFIEDNIKLLSKEYKDPDRWKTILWVSFLAICIIAWFVISILMRRVKPNTPPTNLKVEPVSITELKLSWDKVDLATEGYYVWIMEENNKDQEERYYHTLETNYTFKIEPNKTYILYVKTVETEYLGESEKVYITYENK